MVGDTVDQTKWVGLTLLALFFILRSRSVRAQARKSKPEPMEAHSEAATSVSAGAPDTGAGSTPVASFEAPHEPEVERLPQKTLVVGKGGRFYRCTEYSQSGRETTEVVEVDGAGAARGEEREREGKIVDVLQELI